MKNKRSGSHPVEPGSMRCTRNRTRRQQDEEPRMAGDSPLVHLEESPFGRSCPAVRRQPDVQSKDMDPALEETLLAFLDTHGVRDPEDIEEDNFAFIEATYARCGVRDEASVPTQKMFEAIFRNIQESQSVELKTASFQLLKDLDKRHPRVAIVTEEAVESAGQSIQRLDIDRRVWSPIESLIEELASTDRMLPYPPVEEAIPLNLLTLVETIASNISGQGIQLADGSSCPALNSDDDAKVAGQFLILEHLVGLIQNDVSCCLQVYEASRDHSAVQKSDLYRLLCALTADVRKTFLSNLVSVLNPSGQHLQMDEEFLHGKKVGHSLDNAPTVLPTPRDFSHLACRLLLMILEIDHVVRTRAPVSSSSKRRGSFPDDLLSTFSNARDLEAYLEGIASCRTKLRFVVDYFAANAPVGMIVNGLKDSVGRDLFEKLLACFQKDKMKKFVHKFGEDVLAVLLAHAFQAFLIVHTEAAGEENEVERRAELMQMSRSLVEILTELRELERQTELLPVAENAILMATSILTSDS